MRLVRARRGVNTSSGASTKKSIIITPADRSRARTNPDLYDRGRLERARSRQRPTQRHQGLCRRATLLRESAAVVRDEPLRLRPGTRISRARRPMPMAGSPTASASPAVGALLAARSSNSARRAPVPRQSGERGNNFRYALAQRGRWHAFANPRSAYRAGSRGLLFQAFGWSRRLIRHDPDNADWQLFRAFMDCELY